MNNVLLYLLSGIFAVALASCTTVEIADLPPPGTAENISSSGVYNDESAKTRSSSSAGTALTPFSSSSISIQQQSSSSMMQSNSSIALSSSSQQQQSSSSITSTTTSSSSNAVISQSSSSRQQSSSSTSMSYSSSGNSGQGYISGQVNFADYNGNYVGPLVGGITFVGNFNYGGMECYAENNSEDFDMGCQFDGGTYIGGANKIINSWATDRSPSYIGNITSTSIYCDIPLGKVVYCRPGNSGRMY